jgi:hypothetical protein
MRMYPVRVACGVIFSFVFAVLSYGQDSKAPTLPGSEYSGMYSFLRDGEYVQITVEEKGKVSGFVSRYGDSDSDRGAFLDQFFKQGTLDGNKLTFSTVIVHGVWFDFKGTVEKGEVKKADEEGAYILKGTLTQYTTDAAEKTTSRSREVGLKSFPQDLSSVPPKKD